MHTPRRFLLLAAIGLIAIALGFIFSKSSNLSAIPMHDFVEYWSAAKVMQAGGNPYDGQQLLPFQRIALNEPDHPQAMMMWNPPPAMALVLPLASLNASTAHLVWLAIQFGCLILSSTWLWKAYGGPRNSIWLAWLLAMLFAPSFFLIWYGQIGGLLLLGLSGFLFFQSRERYWLAGAFAALTAIKPHLLFAFGWVLILDATMNRNTRKVIFAGALVVAIAGLIAWVINPTVYYDYMNASWQKDGEANVSPKQWEHPLIAFWLRQAIDPDRFWIQFVPMAVTIVVVTFVWWRKRCDWIWLNSSSRPATLPRGENPNGSPWLVIVSALFTPYGAWIFDLVILQIAVIPCAIQVLTQSRWRQFVFAILYIMASLGVWLSPMIKQFFMGTRNVGLQEFIWFTPAIATIVFISLRKNRVDQSNRLH